MRTITNIFLLIICLAVVSYSQKVEIKDADNNILMEVNDEGRTGSIKLLNSSTAPLDRAFKLYIVNNDLHWNGIKMATEENAAGWQLSGSDIIPVDLNSKVGIGTATPSYSLQVEGTSTNAITMALTNLSNSGYQRLLFGSNAAADGSIILFGTNSLLNANKFRFLNNRTGGLFDWWIDGTEMMSLKSSGLLDVAGSLKIGDDGVTLSAGVMRYTTSDGFEGYDGSSWLSLVEGGKWLENGDDIYYNNGNVGIGTNTPVHEFQVEGNTVNNIRLSLNNLNSLGNQGILLGSSTATDGSITLIGASNPFVPNLFQFKNLRPGGYFNWVLADGEKLSLDPSGLYLQGDLGVGTTTPTAKTHILQTGTGDAFRVEDDTLDTTPFVITSNGKVGIGTSTPSADLQVGTAYFYGSGAVLPEGTGGRLMWIRDKSAFRAGAAGPDSWNDVNIGLYSIALGYHTKAIGESAVALGYGAQAAANYSFSAGWGADALSDWSFAIGFEAQSEADYGIAIGPYSKAMGLYSLAIGTGAETFGDYSNAFGRGTLTDSYASYAVGIYNNGGGGNATEWVDDDPLFMIGNGTSDVSRSNAMTILKNGDIGIGEDSPEAKLDINGSAKIGVNGIVIGEIYELTATLGTSGVDTLFFPPGFSRLNTRVLSAEWERDFSVGGNKVGSEWKSFGLNSSGDYIEYRLYSLFTTKIIKIAYTSFFEEKDIRIILMRVE